MNRLLLSLVLACMLATGFAMYHVFTGFHRSQNEAAPRPVIYVYTHSSFMNPTGPGPEIAALFSEQCLCDIKFIDTGGGGLLLQKLQLGGEPRADLVIGLDQLMLKEAMLKVKWRNLTPSIRDWQPIFANNHYPHFIPYDWSPMVFLTKGRPKKYKTLKEFLDKIPRSSLSLPDPRLSSPGQQFLFWLFTFNSDEGLKKQLKVLNKKLYTVAPDWSASYGLFRRGNAKYTFTYLTSLVYHWSKQEVDYHPILFEHEHPSQIEYAAVPDSCISCGLAERFVDFLSSDKAQKILMEKNYMLPIVKNIEADTLYDRLPVIKPLHSFKMDLYIDSKKYLFDLWEDAIQK